MGEDLSLDDISTLIIAHLDAPVTIIQHPAYSRCRAFFQTKLATDTLTEAFFVEKAEQI
jgi:hypothetical protein